MSVRAEFKVHRLNPSGLARADALAGEFSKLLETVERAAASQSDKAAPPTSGRELALARTALQEACFWAKRALALNPDNQEG